MLVWTALKTFHNSNYASSYRTRNNNQQDFAPMERYWISVPVSDAFCVKYPRKNKDQQLLTFNALISLTVPVHSFPEVNCAISLRNNENRISSSQQHRILEMRRNVNKRPMNTRCKKNSVKTKIYFSTWTRKSHKFSFIALVYVASICFNPGNSAISLRRYWVGTCVWIGFLSR